MLTIGFCAILPVHAALPTLLYNWISSPRRVNAGSVENATCRAGGWGKPHVTGSLALCALDALALLLPEPTRLSDNNRDRAACTTRTTWPTRARSHFTH